jgi:hypothetical protein
MSNPAEMRIDAIYANIQMYLCVNEPAWIRLMEAKNNDANNSSVSVAYNLIQYAVFKYKKGRNIDGAIALLENALQIGIKTGDHRYDQEAMDILMFLCPKHKILHDDKNDIIFSCVYTHQK